MSKAALAEEPKPEATEVPVTVAVTTEPDPIPYPDGSLEPTAVSALEARLQVLDYLIDCGLRDRSNLERDLARTDEQLAHNSAERADIKQVIALLRGEA